MADWSDLMGLTIQQAADKVEKYDYKLRVTHYNENPVAVFRDYRGNRINVWIGRKHAYENWRVTKVTGVN